MGRQRRLPCELEPECCNVSCTGRPKERGKTIAQIIRELVINDKLVTKTDVQTVIELKRIGNNINQIAKHLNENKNNLTQDVISDYQSQLENLEDKIQKVVHYISEGE